MIRNKTRSPGGTWVLALAAAGTFLVAAACGDDGESASNPFCDDFTEFDEKWEGRTTLEDFLAGQMDEAESQEVIADLESLDPPDEIAAEWPDFVAAIETLVTDPESVAANPESLGDMEAVQKVQSYVNEQCTSSG